MVTDFKTLVSLCKNELINREYAAIHLSRINAEWENLADWMKLHNPKFMINCTLHLQTSFIHHSKPSV